MACGAGRPRLLFVPRVASHTTDAFMYADRCPVVAAGNLHCRNGRVALIAERLPLVAAHADAASAFEDLRQRQVRQSNELLCTPVEERHGGARDVLRRTRHIALQAGLYQHWPFPMDLMTRQARYRRFF